MMPSQHTDRARVSSPRRMAWKAGGRFTDPARRHRISVPPLRPHQAGAATSVSLLPCQHSRPGPGLERPPVDLAQSYLVRVEPGSDELLLGKAFCIAARRRPTHGCFLVERYRPITDGTTLADR